jgi:hypothetical protein
MNTTSRSLELARAIQLDAADIVAAHERAKIIHGTGDIRASGNEVEQMVRKVLRRKLPTSYYVGHGHIIDSQLVTSSQLDVIITDNGEAPVLFQTDDGTEYFPYESVYAVGEIKATYYKSKNPVHKFVKTIAELKSNLKRDQTPKETLPHYLRRRGDTPLITNLAQLYELVRYRNPLFSFMLFVDSKDFQMDHITELYESEPAAHLPNVVCFLDKGIVLNAQIRSDEDGFEILESYDVWPEFYADVSGYHWCFAPFGEDTNRFGSNLGVLYFMLMEHFMQCILMPPRMLIYLKRCFSYEKRQVQIITRDGHR